MDPNKNSNKNFKKRLGIVCGIVSIFIIVIVVSTNIPNLIYRDVASVISEIKISNPIQTYKINTGCELSYAWIDSIHTQRSPLILIIPEMLDTKTVIAVHQKYATGYDKSIPPDKWDAVNAEFFDISVKRTMEKNSINPNLEPKIRMWISSFMAYKYENLILPLSSQEIVDDPECAKKMKMYYPQMVNAP